MRLTELNPILDHTIEPEVAYLWFDCPHCGKSSIIGIKMAVNPDPSAKTVWRWNGELDFNKMTIEPSINCFDHWHGYIRDGEVINA